jgi:hypothetical protein
VKERGFALFNRAKPDQGAKPPGGSRAESV